MQSLLEKKQELTSEREKLPSAILFCQQPQQLLRMRKLTISPLCRYFLLLVVRYFLLLNQLIGLEKFLQVRVMAVRLGCINMMGCIFIKRCWSAGIPGRKLNHDILTRFNKFAASSL